MLTNGPANAQWTIVLAHGAGAGMDTPFMNFFAEELANDGIRVVRFEFPYMSAKRTTGKSGPPNREPVLRQSWLNVIEQLGSRNLVIGGKSMGRRIASLLADEAGVRGLICLGYPFHPVGRPEQLRVEHLRTIQTPTLILQGERDPFGTGTEVASYDLSRHVTVKWLKDGDHGYKPRKSSGVTEKQNWEFAIAEISTFLRNLGN